MEGATRLACKSHLNRMLQRTYVLIAVYAFEQRLEFLGDAVVDYLITSYLYSSYPTIKPGQLTDLKTLTVNNDFFANMAVQCSLHSCLISDSRALSETINKFVDFKEASASEQALVNEPKCPKVQPQLYFLSRLITNKCRYNLMNILRT